MKKFFSLVFMMILLVTFSACKSDISSSGVNNGDWSYQLPNNYEIWHINSREIICGKKSGEHSLSNIIEENYISEFKYDNCYVCIKCVTSSKDLSTEIDTSNPKFYIIDTEEDSVYGSYANVDYEKKAIDLGVSSDLKWIKTVPIPDGAIFE